MKIMINALTGICMLGLSPTVLALQSDSSDRSQADRPLHQRLLACRDIDSGVERLDCYDRLASMAAERSDSDRENRRAQGEEARESAQLRAAANRERADVRQEQAIERAAEARETAEERRQQRNTSDFGREHRRDAGAPDERQYVAISEAWQNPRGLWRFRLDDGAEWHQTQSDRFQYDEDRTYYIQRGALNSFLLGWDDSNRTIRVRRVD